MIDGILNSALMFIAVWDPSVLSQGYGILAISLWCLNLRKQSIPGAPYKALIIYSLLVFIGKFIILLIYRINPSLDSFTNSDSFKLFGITLTRRFNLDMFMNFYSELIGIIISILGLLYKRHLLSQPKNRISLNFLSSFVIFSLIAQSLSYYSLVNASHFVFLILWISFWGYRVNERFLLLGISIISLISLIQMITTSLYLVIAPKALSEDFSAFLGILVLNKATGFNYCTAFLLFLSTSCIIRRLVASGFQLAKNTNLNDELIKKAGDNSEASSFFSQILNYLSFTLLYGICVFNIFLWIANFHGYVQLIMMVWLFYSIIEPKMERLMQITRSFFIPILILDSSLLYLVNLMDYDVDGYIGYYLRDYSYWYLLYEIITIATFLLLQRRFKKKLIDKNKDSVNVNFVISLLLENSNKIALIVVFIIGLSRINLFHVGFMIIFLVFMMNSRISRQYWIILVLYTQLNLICQYILNLMVFSGYSKDSSTALDVIGLENKEFIIVAIIFPKNYLVWMLLLSAAMQLSAYRSSFIANKRRSIVPSSNSLVIAFFSKVYKLVLFLFTWIVYIILFLTINLSTLNLLNFFRYLLLLFLFGLHVLNTHQAIQINSKQVDKKWYLLIYYSGFVLVIRYLYQFFRYTNLNFESKFVGLEVYSNGELYENMVSDCVILLVAVYENNMKNALRRSVEPGTGISTITEIIKDKSEKSEGERGNYERIKEIVGKLFLYVYIVIIIVAAVFWRLSISMFIYTILIAAYIISVQRHVTFKMAHNQLKETEVLMNYRILLWKVLMILTMSFLIISYCCFCITKSYLHESYKSVVWTYFLLGFSTSSSSLIKVTYFYLIIFSLLTIERHFIDGFKFEREINETPSNPKISLIVKVIVESFLPSYVIAIGFYKLTIVSLMYMVAVIVSIKLESFKRTIFLLYIVVIYSSIQYIILLINLSHYDSPYPMPVNDFKPFWQKIYDHPDSDILTYLNLGNKVEQTYGLIGDFLILWVLCVFYQLFSTANTEIAEVLSKQGLSLNKKQKNYKELIYSLTYFSILFIVLIFVSESNGFFSLSYCIYSLVIFFLAIRILNTLKWFKFYLNLLKKLLIPLLCFELFMQCAFQLPIHNYFNSTDEAWMEVIGLSQLWRANGRSPAHVSEKYKAIYFKIFTLGFILLVYWMMNTKDYLEFVERLSAKYRVKAKNLGLEIAQKFNDYRLKEMEEHKFAAEKSEKELERLDENVKKWNEKFVESRAVDFGINKKRGDTAPKEHSFEELKHQFKPGIMRIFQNLALGQINQVLFKTFLCRIKRKKNLFIDKQQEKIDGKEMVSSSGLNSDASAESVLETLEKEKLIRKLKKKQQPYILTYRDWMKIFLYICCSSTQGLVFLFFFINHFYYASLESVVFPISALFYGMLAFPRPSPNYFRLMLIYTESVFLIKFILNLYIFDFLDQNFHDPAKIGFNFVQNTYSKNLTSYIMLDAICMLALLAHEYFLVRCGLNDKTEIEIESLQQAKVRKYMRHDYDINALNQTEKRPKLSFGIRLTDFLNKLGGSNDEKPGFDYYTRTVLIQLVLLLFILLFFTRMGGNSSSNDTIFVINTFPGNLVVALIIQTSIMLIERYLYLEVTSSSSTTSSKEYSLKYKFLFHLCLSLFIHILIFWYFPLNSNYNQSGKYYCSRLYDSYKCNNFEINAALQFFYFFYFIYFIFSALQIKYGAPRSRAGEFVLMKSYNTVSNITFLIYKGMPFLYEIRTLIDWTFTSTALTLFQWFKFEDIYASLYNTKCDQLDFAEHPRGEKLGKCHKVFKGCCFLFGVLLIIIAPLIIFSSLNPIVYSNPVKQLTFSVGVRTSNSNFFELSRITTIDKKERISDSDWDDEGFDEANEISVADKENMEKFTLSMIPSTFWLAPSNFKSDFCNSLQTPGKNVYIQLQYIFGREYPSSQQTTTTTDASKLTSAEIESLYKTVCNVTSNKFFEKLKAFSSTIRLLSTGTSLTPIIIHSTLLKNSIFLRFNSTDQEDYWQVGSKFNSPYSLYIISEKYSPVTFNFSVITFYISIVYVVGKLLRMIISGGANNIPLTDMPNPDPLINMCAGIYICRMSGNLYREEVLYYDLIDILRSPELMKMISGSSSIKPKDE